MPPSSLPVELWVIILKLAYEDGASDPNEHAGVRFFKHASEYANFSNSISYDKTWDRIRLVCRLFRSIVPTDKPPHIRAAAEWEKSPSKPPLFKLMANPSAFQHACALEIDLNRLGFEGANPLEVEAFFYDPTITMPNIRLLAFTFRNRRRGDRRFWGAVNETFPYLQVFYLRAERGPVQDGDRETVVFQDLQTLNVIGVTTTANLSFPALRHVSVDHRFAQTYASSRTSGELRTLSFVLAGTVFMAPIPCSVTHLRIRLCEFPRILPPTRGYKLQVLYINIDGWTSISCSMVQKANKCLNPLKLHLDLTALESISAVISEEAIQECRLRGLQFDITARTSRQMMTSGES